MNILGCFKVVPDLEMLSDEDWAADEKNMVNVSFVKNLWNCFDESALEMILKLSDLSESFNMLLQPAALTIGGNDCDAYLKTLYALGYKKAVRIECDQDLRFWPELTARLIAEYVSQKSSQDVIVMGRQSPEGDNGKTPLLTAEELGWPCITQVIDIKPVDEKHLKIKSQTDDGILTQIIETPCVLSVGNAPNSYLRVPTLKDRMRLGKQPIDVFTMENFNLSDEFMNASQEYRITELTKIDTNREGIIITGDTAEEKAYKLYHMYLKGRLDKL